MNSTEENILLSVITILALITIPPLLIIFTPLGRYVKNKRKRFLERLDQFKLSKPKVTTFPRYPVVVVYFTELILALLFIFGLPILIGKFGGNLLPRMFHLGPAATFPLEGEFILMTTLIVLAGCGALLLEEVFILTFPKLGTYLAANKVLGQLIRFGVGYVIKDPAQRHQQIEQVASEYNLRALSLSNARRISKALFVLVALSIPMFVWISRTGVWIDQTTITLNPLMKSPREYTWDQVSEIEISIEDVGKQRTHYSPTFQLFFTDGTSVDLWAGSFTNLTRELRDTCGFAQTHDISIYISPLVTGRLSRFNQHAQKEVLSVVENPLCRTDAYTIEF